MRKIFDIFAASVNWLSLVAVYVVFILPIGFLFCLVEMVRSMATRGIIKTHTILKGDE